MDIVDRQTRSRMMGAIRSRNTSPEMKVRRFIHSQGFRYRLHDTTLPGSPDVVLARYRTVVFVHGCFWHRHPDCRLAATPRSNAEWWQKKFDRNTERDAQKIEILVTQGWNVIVLWECGLRPKNYAAKLAWLPYAVQTPHRLIAEWPPTGNEMNAVSLTAWSRDQSELVHVEVAQRVDETA